MFFQSSALFGAGRYRGGIEGRFLLNAAQTPSTGTLNLLGADLVEVQQPKKRLGAILWAKRASANALG